MFQVNSHKVKKEYNCQLMNKYYLHTLRLLFGDKKEWPDTGLWFQWLKRPRQDGCKFLASTLNPARLFLQNKKKESHIVQIEEPYY